MSKSKNTNELSNHKNQSIALIDSFIDGLINNTSVDEKEKSDLRKKADLLCYWIKDYVRLLGKEREFEPKKLKRYKRGEIVKVHLGFRIGSEEGGLHYAVVLDNDNNLSSPTVTVVPLTSVKDKTDVDNLRRGNVYLGNELYNLINLKLNMLNKTVRDLLDQANEQLNKASNKEDMDGFRKKIAELTKQFKLIEKTKHEIEKMKQGSIALVNQIVTISKLRIYDPKSNYDVLAGIKLSDVSLDKIDNEIIANFTKSK